MQIIKVNCLTPNPNIVELAAQTIQNHGVVVVPTETVYGLVCSVFDDSAVKRIFEIKGRTFDKPLPVFFSSIEQIVAVIGSENVPDSAIQLFRNYAPGPITVIIKCGKSIPTLVTAQTETVGIRIPQSALILSLIERVGIPLASTSANHSQQPSHTDAQAVIAELGDSVDLILDAGICGSGKPSTVVDLTAEPPKVLREGEITVAQLREILGVIEPC
ncbi:MAG: L-threonylcarbamoyladenylate synthase [bacterium]|nr:L-threonylcarbamoyladenylate synthase [bacterium]